MSNSIERLHQAICSICGQTITELSASLAERAMRKHLRNEHTNQDAPFNVTPFPRTREAPSTQERPKRPNH